MGSTPTTVQGSLHSQPKNMILCSHVLVIYINDNFFFHLRCFVLFETGTQIA